MDLKNRMKGVTKFETFVVATVLMVVIFTVNSLFHYSPALEVLYVTPIWAATRLSGRWFGLLFVALVTMTLAIPQLAFHGPPHLDAIIQPSLLRLASFGAITLFIAEVETKLALTTLEAQLDPLTGLLNRRALLRLHEDKLPTGAANTITLVMIDCDGFKAINDEHGHLVGDQILQILARILQRHTRRSDLVSRFGGDEFVIAFQAIPIDRTLQVMQRIDSAFSEAVAGAGYTASISYGCAVSEQQVATMSDLIELADQEMYRQKVRKRTMLIR